MFGCYSDRISTHFQLSDESSLHFVFHLQFKVVLNCLILEYFSLCDNYLLDVNLFLPEMVPQAKRL